MKTHEILFQTLSQADDYVNGEQLAKELGVSRTSIWKAIQRLEKDGVIIESLKKKGYKLVSGDILLPEVIASNTQLTVSIPPPRPHSSIEFQRQGMPPPCLRHDHFIQRLNPRGNACAPTGGSKSELTGPIRTPRPHLSISVNQEGVFLTTIQRNDLVHPCQIRHLLRDIVPPIFSTPEAKLIPRIFPKTPSRFIRFYYMGMAITGANRQTLLHR